MSSIVARARELGRYLDDREPLIRDGEITGSHLLGVSKKAGQMFEALLSATLLEIIRKSGFSYEADLKPKLRNQKPYDRLTLGERVECFSMIMDRGGAKGISDPSLKLTNVLRKISRLRSDIEHKPSEQSLRDRTLEMMELLRVAIGDSLFHADTSTRSSNS